MADGEKYSCKQTLSHLPWRRTLFREDINTQVLVSSFGLLSEFDKHRIEFCVYSEVSLARFSPVTQVVDLFLK